MTKVRSARRGGTGSYVGKRRHRLFRGVESRGNGVVALPFQSRGASSSWTRGHSDGGVGFSETREACPCISSISSVGREILRYAFQSEPGCENGEFREGDESFRSGNGLAEATYGLQSQENQTGYSENKGEDTDLYRNGVRKQGVGAGSALDHAVGHLRAAGRVGSGESNNDQQTADGDQETNEKVPKAAAHIL